jgi:hypothetical protein
VQFYVEGIDALGNTSTFPAAGSDSRALYKVEDGQSRLEDMHNLRIIVTADDAAWMHTNANLMSNQFIGATVIYDESQVFYDVGVRLKGTTYGRTSDQFVSYIVHFHPDNKFRGVHDSIAIDRSARGPVGSPNIDEIVIKHVIDHAGGIASQNGDVIRVIAPRSAHTSVALLIMARYGDIFSTTDGHPESPKVIRPNGISYTDIRDLGDNKESYRLNWVIKDNRSEDDYDPIIAMNKAFSLVGTTLDGVIGDVIDVNQWARHYAVLSLTGVSDTYTHGNPHNLRVYQRPEDGRFISLPHDMDTSFRRATNVGLMGGSNWNLVKIFQRPQYTRLFYGNLLDIIDSTYNTAYMEQWTDHYGDLAGTSFAGILGYIGARASFVQSQIAALSPQVPFEITTSGGNDFSVDAGTATLSGTGWVNVKRIEIDGRLDPPDIVWTSENQWTTTVSVAPGANVLTLRAFDYQGDLIDTDTLTVTSTVVQPLVDSLRIGELMYHPGNVTPEEAALGFADDNDFEFIELVNIGTESIHLGGARFTDGIEFTFGDVDLAPGERILVVRDIGAFEARYGTGLNVAGEYGNNQEDAGIRKLSNGGETVTLETALGTIIQSFVYDDNGSGWHPTTDGDGYSLVIIDATGPTASWNDGAAWQPSAELGGSPGADEVLPGDVDGNHRVDLVDLALLQSHLGTLVGAERSDGDFNGDGAVTRADAAILLRNLGRGSTSPAPSPAAALAPVRDTSSVALPTADAGASTDRSDDTDLPRRSARRIEARAVRTSRDDRYAPAVDFIHATLFGANPAQADDNLRPTRRLARRATGDLAPLQQAGEA